MFKTTRESFVEDVDVTATPVHDLPDVKEAQQRFANAVAESLSADAELKKLNGLLSPYTNKDAVTNELQCIRARLEYPQVQQRQLLAEAVKIEAERTLAQVRDRACQRIVEARVPGRKPLVKALFAEMERCVELAEELDRYDQATYFLTGAQLGGPFPQLLRSWNGTENQVECQRRHLAEWLD